jgi:hypothetical protein
VKQLPRGSDTRAAVRSLAAAIRGMDTRLAELRREVAALRKDVPPLWHWHGEDTGWKPADPVQERIDAIEARLSAQMREG